MDLTKQEFMGQGRWGGASQRLAFIPQPWVEVVSPLSELLGGMAGLRTAGQAEQGAAASSAGRNSLLSPFGWSAGGSESLA